MPAYVEVYTDSSVPGDFQLCGGSVCCSLARMEQPYYGSTYLSFQDKIAVVGGHQTFTIPDSVFDINRILVGIVLIYGRAQWGDQFYITPGQTKRITYYFETPSCSIGEEECRDGEIWRCMTGQLWANTHQVCGGPTPPEPICTPGSTKCSGTDLYQCNTDGTQWMDTGLPCDQEPPPGPDGTTLPWTYIVVIVLVVALAGLMILGRKKGG